MKKKGDKSLLDKRLAQLAGMNSKPAPPSSAPASTLPPVVKGKKKQRASERRSTYRFGHIVVSDHLKHPCIIKDLSRTGARIVLEGDFGLPSRVLFKAELMSIEKPAAVVWQREREVGLAFEIDTTEADREG